MATIILMIVILVLQAMLFIKNWSKNKVRVSLVMIQAVL